MEGSRAAAVLLDKAGEGGVRRPLGARLRNIRAILSVRASSTSYGLSSLHSCLLCFSKQRGRAAAKRLNFQQ